MNWWAKLKYKYYKKKGFYLDAGKHMAVKPTKDGNIIKYL